MGQMEYFVGIFGLLVSCTVFRPRRSVHFVSRAVPYHLFVLLALIVPETVDVVPSEQPVKIA
jgi:hypothetical protein